MAESVRLMGRNGAIWREYCRGATQEELAEKYGLTQGAVSNAIRAVADSIPQQERMELVHQEVDFLRQTRREIMDLWDLGAPPVTAGKDGDVVRDPDTDEVVRDYSGKLNAARVGLEYTKFIAKLLDLEASKKITIDSGEEAAARQQAAEAAAFLHGGEADA